jgi:hypothetical protein
MPIITEKIELQTNDPANTLRLTDVEKHAGGGDSSYSCALTVHSNGFACIRRFDFDGDSLTAAIASLLKMTAGTPDEATLEYRHEADFLRFTMNRLGHVIVRGELYHYGELSHSLKFAFRTDQTVLSPWLEALIVLHNA